MTKVWWFERGDNWRKEICQQVLAMDCTEGHGRQNDSSISPTIYSIKSMYFTNASEGSKF